MKRFFGMATFLGCCLGFASMAFGGEPSETACTAKCNTSNGIDKEAIQNAYEVLEEKAFEKKDELLDNFKDFLLNEDDHPSEDYQSHLEEMGTRWDEDIESVDFNKVKEDSRTILQEMVEWVQSLDLTSLRQDAEKQVDYYRKYIEDYRAIKDDFIDGSITGFLNDFLNGLNLEATIKQIGGKSGRTEEKTLKTDGFKQMTKGRKNKARLKALVNEAKNRFNEIKEERQDDYEELKEKYKNVHNDLKNKKRHWLELKKSWRRKNDGDDDDDDDDDDYYEERRGK